MDSDAIFEVVVTLLLFGGWLAISGGILFLLHRLVTLPMRRAERARLFLDVIETSLKTGRPVEETVISISRSRDMSMGALFHRLAARLEQGAGLFDAFDKVPRFLPPQISAMLKAGKRIGDLGKVLPACRQLLKDGVSQTRAAVSYLVILTLVITPAGVWIFGVLEAMVMTKFIEISNGTLGGDASATAFVYRYRLDIMITQIAVLTLLWLGAITYLGGPRLARWFPILQRVHYWLPWRRKRMQRDFSSLRATLLDGGVPEADAVYLAAECSANRPFKRRAIRVAAALERGIKLPEAVQFMDDSGEFAWRLANAAHGKLGFFPALSGWHDWLDAKAFQQEQAVAHGITTALVLWGGVFVGVVVVSVFAFLVSLVDEGVLW
jgi:type II secretory pathway component PulF